MNTPERVVLDIGASIGIFADFVAKQNLKFDKKIRVIAVEPLEDVARQIPTRSNLEVVIKAIMPNDLIPQSGFMTMSRMEFSELSTFLKVNSNLDKELWEAHLPLMQIVSKVEVKCISLAELIICMQLQKIDFIKIDTQGTDLQVLKSAGVHISKIMSCVLEFPYTSMGALYESETNLVEGLAEMNKLGFIPLRIVPNGGGECNVFFLNTEYSLQEYFVLEKELNFAKAPVLKLDLSKASIKSRVYLFYKVSAFKTKRLLQKKIKL
jgi:FkbM family methyltransferase